MANDPGYRRTWRLRGLRDEYLVVRGAPPQLQGQQRRVEAAAVPARLRSLRGDSLAERTLLEIYESLGGQVRTGRSAREWHVFLEHVWAQLGEAFRTKRLTLLQVPRPVVMLRAVENAQEDDWSDAPPPTGWLGVQLQDDEGEPVANQRVRIKLADGTVRQSVTDDKGRLRLEGIPQGTCEVELVGIDGSDWRAA